VPPQRGARGVPLGQPQLRPVDRQAQRRVPPPRPGQHGLERLRAHAVAEAAVARARRPTAPPAMHAADPLAPHRRLPARPMVVPAPRLAARRQLEVAAPVAVAQRPMAHGVD